jgi:hypothetical protein
MQTFFFNEAGREENSPLIILMEMCPMIATIIATCVYKSSLLLTWHLETASGRRPLINVHGLNR